MTSLPPDRTPRPDLHRVINGEEADANCPTLHGFIAINCPHCGQRYIIHCERCEQQASNCACTMSEVLTRAREEAARRSEEAETGTHRPWMDKKLWTPGNN